uniref:PH domain-containing protein n=1 Tax=Noctiluca scintillans TaxID=2966 RepID=A0A7S1ACU6_NOCSC
MTCASLREEECFVLDAGKCVYIWCGRRSSPSDDTACTSLAQCRVEERRVDQCQATREIDDQFWDLLGGSTPIQSGALPRVVPSGFLTARSVQDTFRSVDPATEVTAPGCKRTVTFEEANSKRDLARTSTDHEAGKTDLKETTKLGQRADSVADEDFPPVEHVPSDFDTFLVRMPSAQEISAVRTPRVQEVPQAPSTLSIPGSRTVAGPRLLHVWRDGLHTFVADKLPEESLVTQRDVFVLDLVSSLYVYCGEKADPIERELATLVADLRSFSRNGVEVLSSPDERFWSSLGGKSILDAEEFRDEQSSVRVWPVDFSREAGRPSQCLKPEIFHVWREGLDVYVTEVVVSSESLTTFDVFVLDAGDTLYVWGGEQCSQLEVELATFFAEHRKSVRNSDVEVSHTPDLKFWMLLGGECEIDDVRCVRNRSASTKLWGDTHMDPVPERDLVAERIVRNARMSSRKAERARAREQKRAAKVAREGSGPSLEHADVDGPQSRELPLPSKRELLMPAAANVTTDPLSRSEAKLLHVWREGSHTHVDELEAHHDSLTQKDAFVLDVGDALYVWCGDEVDPMEGHAAKFLAQLRQKERAGDATILHEMDDRFWSCLGGRGPIREGIRARAATAGSDAFSVAALPLDVPRGSAPVLLHVWRLDSETHVTEMPVERRSLTHADCFVLDAVHVIYVWCGSRCEVLERHAATFLANMRATQRDAQVMSEVDALFWSLLGGEGPIRGAPAVRKSIAQPIFSGPLAEGWLWKRGPTSHFKWQRRWCVLEAMKLTYYENSARSVKRGHVDLSSSTRAVSFESAKPPGDSIKYCHKRPFGFALDVKPEAGRMRHLEPGLLLYFDAGDAENMELWLAALRHVRH